MIDLLAFRGAGDREGAEIFEPILCSVAAALQRGRYEIDFNAPKIIVEVELPHSPTIRNGDQVVYVDDDGVAQYGFVTSFTHAQDGPELVTNVNLEVRP